MEEKLIAPVVLMIWSQFTIKFHIADYISWQWLTELTENTVSKVFLINFEHERPNCMPLLVLLLLSGEINSPISVTLIIYLLWFQESDIFEMPNIGNVCRINMLWHREYRTRNIQGSVRERRTQPSLVKAVPEWHFKGSATVWYLQSNKSLQFHRLLSAFPGGTIGAYASSSSTSCSSPPFSMCSISWICRNFGRQD